VRSGADADLPLQRWSGDFLVGVDLFGLDARLVVDDHPRARGDADPLRPLSGIGAAELRGHAPLDDGRLHRLEQAVLLAAPQARRIDQEDHVGGARGALGLQPGEDACVVGLDPVDSDAGGLGEVGVERFVGLVVAGRVQVQHLLLGPGGRGEGQAGGRAEHGGDQRDSG